MKRVPRRALVAMCLATGLTMSAPTASSASLPVDIGLLNEQLETLIPGFIDAWAELEFATGSLPGMHGDCATTPSAPTLSGTVISGYSYYSCTKKHTVVAIAVCVQVKVAKQWNCLEPEAGDANENSTFVEATAAVTCQDGTWRYRTRAVGTAQNPAGDIVHVRPAKSGGRTFQCLLIQT